MMLGHGLQLPGNRLVGDLQWHDPVIFCCRARLRRRAVRPAMMRSWSVACRAREESASPGRQRHARSTPSAVELLR